MRNSHATSTKIVTKIHCASKFRRDGSGNVAIITALLMPILIGAAGFAMDYSYAGYNKQKLSKAAEAAVLAAVSQSAATAGGGYSNTAWLKSYGQGIFAGNIAELRLDAVESTLTVTSTGINGVTAAISYSANLPSLFSGIVGINSFPLVGTATAQAKGVTYINYYILVDNSQSMGIAATALDMSNLYNRVISYNNGSGGEVGCVFGCHVTTGSQAHSNEYLAHDIAPPITLRIDSAVTAIQDIIADAKAAAGANNNIKIGLYTLGDDPTTGIELRTVAAPSYNYASLSVAAATIDLGNNTSSGIGDSDFSGELSQFYATLPTSGSGASAASPINYVFIITDGLIDTYGSKCTSGHCTGALNASYCNNIKMRATVGVIYTTYNPIYSQNNTAKGYETNYSSLVAPYVSQIEPNLSSCASSSNYFYEASDGPAIAAGMEALFKQSQQSAILQQ